MSLQLEIDGKRAKCPSAPQNRAAANDRTCPTVLEGFRVSVLVALQEGIVVATKSPLRIRLTEPIEELVMHIWEEPVVEIRIVFGRNPLLAGKVRALLEQKNIIPCLRQQPCHRAAAAAAADHDEIVLLCHAAS